MAALRKIDDVTAEAVIRGDAAPAEFEPLASAVAALRAVPVQPVRPSAELAARMATGDFASAAAVPPARRSAGRHRAARRRLAGLPVRGKVAAAVVVAVGGLTSATVAGALPEGAQQRVQSVIESVTPIDFPGPGEFGREIADDARDGGVDGSEVSEKATQQGAKPDDPATQAPADPKPPGNGVRPAVPAAPDTPADENRPADPAGPKDPPVKPPASGPPEAPGKPDRQPLPEPPTSNNDRASSNERSGGSPSAD